MEFRGGQSNNISPTNAPSAAAPKFSNNGGNKVNLETSNKKFIMIAVVAILIIVIGGLGWWGFQRMQGSASSSINANQYQALFLTNGQVYFGKLSSVDDKYVKLTDIYYLQVQQAVQPADKKAADQPQVSLAKLGSELHAPEDTMMVNRDQVLFFENLKEDGKVVKAIRENTK